MNGRRYRLKLLSGLAAAAVAVSMLGPSYAQSGPTVGTWIAGPDASGTGIIGRVESPRPGQSVNPSANILVSGWAADTSSTSGSGIDGMEVWNGSKDSGGTKLATGSVGLARADIADAFGPTFMNSGFSAVIPGTALSVAAGGPASLYVYIHSPGKGTWHKTETVRVQAQQTLLFPSDPVVFIAKPIDGTAITQRQLNNKFTFAGVAFDRNPITDPNSQSLGPGCPACSGAGGNIATSARGAGVASITAYIDAAPAKGDNSAFVYFGAPCTTACLNSTATVNNAGAFNRFPKPQASIITRQWGSQYDYSGWGITIDPALLTPGFHTLYVTAKSSITGNTSTAQVAFQILDMNHLKIQP